MSFHFVAFLLVCVIAVIATPLLAQSPNGNINGLISDPSSAAVVGAAFRNCQRMTRSLALARMNGNEIVVDCCWYRGQLKEVNRAQRS